MIHSHYFRPSTCTVHLADAKARPKVKEGEHVVVVAARKCRGEVRFQVEDEVNDELNQPVFLQGGPTREERES